MNDVFISYKSEEFEVADWVRNKLESNGISCWMAPMSIAGGSSYANEIPQAIRECRFFVLILSEKAQLSKWVPKELDQAINEGKIVLPFAVDTYPLKDDFKFYLTNVQYYAAYEDKNAAINKMIKEIRALLGCDQAASDDLSSVADKLKDNPDTASRADSDCDVTPQQNIKTAKKTAKKERKKATSVKSKKRKKSVPIILGGVAAFIVLLTAAFWTVKSLNTITVCGEKFNKNASSVSLSNAALTLKDIQSFGEFTRVSTIYLSNCTFEDSDINAVCADSCSALTLDNCGLTDDILNSIDFKSKSLRTLGLNNNPKITDFSIISSLSGSLTDLSVCNCNIDDLSFMSGCTKLESLAASNNQISDLSPISQCAALRRLELTDNKITDLSPISNCTEIRKLNVSGNQIDSLNVLSNFEKLESINVGKNKLSDFSGLEKSISLIEILAENNKISSLKGIENTSALVTVDLNDNGLTDVSVLEKSVSSLKKLYLHNNSIEDISCLSNCTSMIELTVDNNRLTSIDAVSKMKNLEKLSTANNNIADIKAIANCQKLTYINLAKNSITSIDAINANESKIGITLDVSDNKISALALKNYKYSYLALYGNPISDLSALNKTNGSTVVFDYNDKIDFDKFKSSEYINYYIFDCPLDKQLNISNLLDGVVFTNREDYLAAK